MMAAAAEVGHVVCRDVTPCFFVSQYLGLSWVVRKVAVLRYAIHTS